MSNQTSSRAEQSCDSISSLLQRYSQARNLRAIKKLHSHLLRTGLLFICHDFLVDLVTSYYPRVQKTNPQTLNRFLRCINPSSHLSFNMMISDFCRKGFEYFALVTFSFMHRNGVPIDSYPLCSSLKASTMVENVEFGKQIHCVVAKSGWSSSVFLGSALVDMYAKTSLVKDAAEMFDEIPVKNTVCANALITGYGEAKMWVEGLELVRKMPMLDLKHDHFTLAAALRSCAGLSAIELGKQVHAYSIRVMYDVKTDVFLQSTLIEMYGRCGMVEKAWQVFSCSGNKQEEASKRDVVLWTSMLGVYGRNGFHKDVIELFKKMIMEGIRPDEVASVTVISACRHTGQVTLGMAFFDSMADQFGLEPGPNHYSCVIDMLCRAGELDRAWKMINLIQSREPGSCTVSMWGALLSACRDHGNLELGKLAAHKAVELDPQNVGIYVMLSNLYARFGMWSEMEHLRELVRERGLKKDVGYSRLKITS